LIVCGLRESTFGGNGSEICETNCVSIFFFLRITTNLNQDVLSVTALVCVMQMAQRLPRATTSKDVFLQIQFSIWSAVPPLFWHTDESWTRGRQTAWHAVGTSPFVIPSAAINRMAGTKASRVGKAKERMITVNI
jgi:hypothetical protein